MLNCTHDLLPQAVQALTYDADGNLTADGLWNYQFDGENRLVRMSTVASALPGGFPDRVLEFKHDHLGRRVQKTVQEWSVVSGQWSVVSARRFLYDGWNLVAEYAATATTIGGLTRSYTWGLDLVGSLSASGGVGALLQIRDEAQNKTLFPTYDGNGNVAALFDADTGVTAAAYEYSPFGEPLRTEGYYAKENPFRFSTKFTDDETGLVYYGRRYYSPWHGRFVSRDPKEESGGRHLYAFLANNSPNRWDYLGMLDGFLGCGWAAAYGAWVSSSPYDDPSYLNRVNQDQEDARRLVQLQNEALQAKLRSDLNVLLNQTQVTPAIRDLALVSADVYGPGKLPPHIQAVSAADIAKLGLDPAAFHTQSGLDSGLYLNTETGQYILAFRGTEGKGDIGADFTQALGITTAQYQEAIALAVRVDRVTGGNFISTGHSLGGGLASAAAIVTGTNAITFNAAGLNSATVATFGADLSNASNLITAVSVRGEILTTAQNLTPFPDAVGTPVRLQPGSDAGPLTLHGIDQVLLAIGDPSTLEPMGPFFPPGS